MFGRCSRDAVKYVCFALKFSRKSDRHNSNKIINKLPPKRTEWLVILFLFTFFSQTDVHFSSNKTFIREFMTESNDEKVKKNRKWRLIVAGSKFAQTELSVSIKILFSNKFRFFVSSSLFFIHMAACLRALRPYRHV